MKMVNGSIVSAAVTAGLVAQAAPGAVSSSELTQLGWSVLSAVLAAVLSWLSGRRPAVKE